MTKKNNEIEKYWLHRLAGDLVKSWFPYDKQRIDTRREFSDTCKFKFRDDLFSKLMKLSNNSLPRLQMILTAGLITLLSKYSGNKDIIIGTPIYKQEVKAEFVNTILPLRNRLFEQITFKGLLLQVRETLIQADENQNYPVEKLLQKMKIPYSKDDDFPLFDVVVLLENIQDKTYIRDIYPNMLFSFRQTGKTVEGMVEYNSILYEKETVERIIIHFQILMQSVLSDIDIPLTGISILTPEEKRELVEEFNGTDAEYPGDKTIIELFCQQAVETPDKPAVVYKDNQLTYKELETQAIELSLILRKRGINADRSVGIISNPSIETLIGILGILKAGGAFLPIDPENPKSRIKYILEDSNMPLLLVQNHLLEQDPSLRGLLSRRDFIVLGQLDQQEIKAGKSIDPVLKSGPGHMAYIIYTSGTTGNPKGTVIDNQGLVNYIHWAAGQYITKNYGNFPLFTSIAFDLTVTSIFTPLVTGNAIIVYCDENRDKGALIEKIILEKRCGVVKITPSHLKLIRDKKIRNHRIRRFIVGGEELETELVKGIVANLGNDIDIINEYGPTETVVGCMKHAFDRGKDTGTSVPLGGPASNMRIYLLDRGFQPVPIGVTGEIYISGDGIARGYLNQPELTAEKFLAMDQHGYLHPFLNKHKQFFQGNEDHRHGQKVRDFFTLRPGRGRQKLYKTGDLAKWRKGNVLEFTGRADHQLKIRGYRIEIGEIESRISAHPKVKQTAVVVHTDDMGEKRLAAYMVPWNEESYSNLQKEFSQYLKENLPDYMIPNPIIFLEEIPLTPNGKIDRKKLPELIHRSKAAYTPPRDELEKKLVDIWSENLGVPKAKIGIDADYFELGGHSLKATVLLNVLHKEFHVKLPMMEIFKRPTLKDLAEHIKGMEKENFKTVNPVEEKEYYDLSSAQRRLFILQQMDPQGTVYNVPVKILLSGQLNLQKLEKVFIQLIQRHESLRTSFEMINQNPVQKIRKTVGFSLEMIDTTRSRSKRTLKNFQDPFQLSRAPLLRVRLIEEEEQKYTLLVEMHHIITDGVSMDLVVKEFMMLYAGKTPPSLKLRYRDYANWQTHRRQSSKYERERKYWQDQFEGEIPCLEIPPDFQRPLIKEFTGSNLSFKLEKEKLIRLKELAGEESATLYMVLLTIFNIFLAKLGNSEDIVIGTPVVGRGHADLENIIGMFVNTLPLRNYPLGEKKFIPFLHEVKEKTLNAFENQDYQYETLVEELGVAIDAGRNPLFDIMFVLQNAEIKEIEVPGLEVNLHEEEHTTSKFDLTLIAEEKDDALILMFEYCTALFKRKTIERFMIYFLRIIAAVIENREKTVSQLEIITEEEKRQILFEFNDTDGEYPYERTIQQLFTEQVEQEPHLLALTGQSLVSNEKNQIQITYSELYRFSQLLAFVLQSKGVKFDTVVGIMTESSIEMAIGILAILKAGGAYLPIAPDSPRERRLYMLEDSGAKLLVTTGKTSGKGEAARIWEGERILLEEVLKPSTYSDLLKTYSNTQIPSVAGEKILPVQNSQPPVTSLAYIIYTSGSTGNPKGVMVRHQGVTNAIYWRAKEYGLGVKDRVLQLFSFTFDGFVTSFFTPIISGSCVVLLSGEETTDIEAVKKIIVAGNIIHFISVPSMYRSLLEICAPGDLSPLREITLAGEAVSPTLLEKSKKIHPQLKISIEYGATENTVVATINRNARTGKRLIIGTPIANMNVFIWDQGEHVLPMGISGEIVVTGVGVARGYLNNPELTAEKFKKPRIDSDSHRFTQRGRYLQPTISAGIRSFQKKNSGIKPGIHKGVIQKKHLTYSTPCPFHRLSIYKTGDLARWLSDGNIEFLGRIDHQVKVRGYRIELGEIESQLLRTGEIKDAVVLAEEAGGEKFLRAYIVSPKTLTLKELKAELSTRLPGYMIPSHFQQVEKIPLTANGKVDRRTLKMTGKQLNWGTGYVAPKNMIQEKIILEWKQILKRDKIGIHDNYFDLGGTSLNIIKLNENLKQTFQVDIPIPVMFRYTTVSTLEGYLRNRIEKEPDLSEGESLRKEDSPLEEAGSRGQEIAVIGMAGKFPGANNLEEFWDNIIHGRETIAFFSTGELRESNIDGDQPDDPNYVKAAGVLGNIDCFDASFFGYTPKEAEIMDPQFRLFHECVWNALEDAGYTPGGYNGLIGLYAGCSSGSRWQARVVISGKHREIGNFAANQLMNKGFLTLRISYKLNLRGPSFELNTACSTSLVAIHTACKALMNGECHIAMAGGVTVSLLEKEGYLYSEGMTLSPDGHCRSFDARAKGTVASDGVGVVVLKPLPKAISDKDHIYAIVKGTSINNDGIYKAGFTAPGVEGQASAIAGAIRIAGVEPESIGYIETHGTGTQLGDPVEIEALRLAFKTRKKSFCALGSVKSNIGHTDTASGVAGFIKTVLALKHQLKPPTVNFETPNPKADLNNTPFYINTELLRWDKSSYPRRAGVSSFGMGGTNAHAVLEEWPLEMRTREADISDQLIILSAKTRTALEKRTKNLEKYFKRNSHIDIADAAYTLQVGREAFKYRRMSVCSTPSQVVELYSDPNERKVHSFVTHHEERPVVFLFSGLGGQYKNMGLGLYREEPVFRQEMECCFKILKSLMEFDIKGILYPEKETDAEPDRLNQPEILQPVIFILGYSLAKLLMKWGIKPYAMMGYSFGEYIAATIAGVFSLPDALKLVVNRSKLINKTAKGTMLSVPMSRDRLLPLIGHELSIAIDNGPSCVLAGTNTAIAAVEKQMIEKRVICTRLNTAHAIHSGLMEPILKEFAEKLGEIKLNKPGIPYISNVTGNWITAEEATSPDHWVKHLRKTVDFDTGIRELVKNPEAIFIEIGPGRDIRALIMRHLEDNSRQKVIHLIRHQQKKVSDTSFLLERLGWLWLWGVKIDWTRYHSGRERQRLPLPGYPFEGKRYWIDAVGMHQMSGLEQAVDAEPKISRWFYYPTWKRVLREPKRSKPNTNRLRCLVFVIDITLVTLLVNRLKQTFQEVVTVKIGETFKQIDKNRFTLNPGDKLHYEQLMEKLRIQKQLPDRIVHLWNITGEEDAGEGTYSGMESFDKKQEPGLYSLLYLTQALGKQNFIHTIYVHVLTDHVQEVVGNETVQPDKSTVLGLLKVIPQEYPALRCSSIDLELPPTGTWEEEKLVDSLLDQFSMETARLEAEIAYRNNRKWKQVFEPVHLESPSPEQMKITLRPKGVFLITGGLGKIGLMFAQLLVKHAGACLVLTGRSPSPSETGSPEIKKIKELERMGGKVIYIQANAANLEQMQGVVKEAEKRFGKINGVIHAAGITEDQSMKIIRDLTPQNCRLHFQAKVSGLKVLEQLFEDSALDFCWLLSSISCVLGGMGLGAYASANRYMDAAVKRHNRISPAGKQWLSLNWEGMDPEKSIDLFERIFTLEETEQLVVSRQGNLEKRIRKWIGLEVPQEEESRKEKEHTTRHQHPRPDLSTNYIPPVTNTEKAITAIWQELLGFAEIGIEDDFLEMGGDSLKINTLITRIHRKLGVNIPVTEIFAKPTVKEIARFVTARLKTEENTFMSINPVETKEFYRLSSAQKRLFVIHRLEKESTTYNLPYIMLLEGRVEFLRLEQAFKGLIKRHESLRTSFRMLQNEPVQIIHKNPEFNIRYVDQAKENKSGTEPYAEKIIERFIRPFDLTQTPLIRAGLINIQDNKYILMIDIHHIISDGVSLKIFIREFESLYEGKELFILKLQYKDFSEWQNSRRYNEEIKKQEQYWLKELKGELPVLNLPADFPRPPVRSDEGKTIPFELDREETEGLKEMARREGTTLFILLLSIYNVMLSKICNQDDILVGTPVQGRRHADLHGIIGFFVNTLALRNHVSGRLNFKMFLDNVKERTLNAFNNQDYQFENLVEEIEPERDMSRNPIFGVMFFLDENIWKEANRNSEKELAGIRVKPYPYTDKTAKFDINLRGVERDEKINFLLEYGTKLFEEETVNRLIGYFKKIIKEVLEDPEKRISKLELTPEEEKNRLLYDLNKTKAKYREHADIPQLFDEQAEKSPHWIAVLGSTLNRDKIQLSYRGLNQLIRQMAKELQSNGIGPDTIAAVMVERSVEMMVALLGILKAGGAYLPIEPNYPQERVKYLLADSRARLLLTGTAVGKTIEIPEVLIPELIERIKASAGKEYPYNLLKPASGRLCYIIYTSGSTGKPKGVMVEHKSAVNILTALQKEYPLKRTGTYLLKTSYLFDVSVTELFGFFWEGGKLAILDRGGEKDPQTIIDTIENWRITHINFVPSMFNAFLEVLNPQNITKLSCLRYIFLAGEVLVPGLVKKFRHWDQRIKLENIYGPTEGTIYATKYSLTQWGGNGSIPIGKPLDNIRIYILDKFGTVQPIGVAGEICIAGTGVARGYLNRPQLTSEKFIIDRWTESEGRLYRTGDVGRRLADGNIECRGRIDNQIKIRGFRVELGEIENQLLKHEEVKAVTVRIREDESGDKNLTAYFVSKITLPVVRLRKFLLNELPDYMIPAYFMQLERIAFTPSGKVDTRALPEPELKRSNRYKAPRNIIESRLVEIWSRLLARDDAHYNRLKTSLGIDDNFFRMGGHSLKVTMLASRIQKEFQVDVSMPELFKHPHIRGIAAIIKQAPAANFNYISLQPVEKRDYYPLSSVQRRLFILQQLDEKLGTAYNLPSLWQLHGEIDERKFRIVLQRLIDRHESLRTCFLVVNDEPVQQIKEKTIAAQWTRPETQPDKPQMETEIMQFIQPFDLFRAPLLRINLIKIHNRKYILMVDMHHIVSDGVSMGTFVREFIQSYSNREMPRLKLQYKDYVQMYRRQGMKTLIQQQESYWLSQLKGELPVLQLPSDRPRPKISNFAGHHLDFALTQEQTAALKSMALQQEVTLFMLLLSIYNVFLAKLSGQEDIIVGTPVAGRRHSDLTGIIGMFVNTLVLRNYPVIGKNFDTFLNEVKSNTVEAFENQDYPYEDLVERMNVERDTGRNPLFDVMLVLQNMEPVTAAVPGLDLKPYPYERRISKFDLTLTAMEVGKQLTFSMEYSINCFETETIRRWIDGFKKIIITLSEKKDIRISDLEIISEKEKRQILYEFNGTQAVYPRNKTLRQQFLEQVEKTPDHIALLNMGSGRNHKTTGQFSYGRLNERIGRVARVLIQSGVKPDTVVGIMTERSLEMIIGIFAIIKASGAYLPINASTPPERVRYQLADSNAKILLTGRDNRFKEPTVAEIIDLKRLCEKRFPDAAQKKCRYPSVPFQTEPGNLAYVIYTSGSTGKPKGVLVNHRPLMNRLNWMQKEYRLDTNDTLVQKTPYTFDVSVWEIFWWAITGARLCLLPPGGEKDPGIITEAIVKNRITVIHFVPSMLNVFLDYLRENGDLNAMISLRRVIASGEVLTLHQVKRFNDVFSRQGKEIRLSNLYGPTEATIDVSHFPCPLSGEPVPQQIPIGKPIDNLFLYVVDKSFRLQPPGITGELCIAGEGLARGYLNRPELTAEKFVAMDRLKLKPGQNIYKTGDLACWQPDGNILFIGRTDNQVKIRGNRIELGEIENRILNVKEIENAVVTVNKTAEADKYICAYFVTRQEYGGGELREILSKDLPEYMLPSHFVKLDCIPLTPNGKIDRKALPLPEIKKSDDHVSPRDEVERKLIAIWAEILGVDAGHARELKEKIGIHANFFQLGGHSLKAAIMVNKIQRNFAVTIPLQKIFRSPTVAGIGQLIKNSKIGSMEDIGPLPEKPYYEMSYAQKRLWYIYRNNPQDTAFNLPARSTFHEPMDAEKVRKVLEGLIIRHESLRTCFKEVEEGPVQVVESPETVIPKLKFTTLDLSQTEKEDRENQRFALLMEEISCVFHLKTAPLFRAKLVKWGPNEFDIILNMHHIVSDGWSFEVLMREFLELYRADEKGKHGALEPLKIQYKDYAAWQNKLLENPEKMRSAREFWKNYLTNSTPPLNLPYDFSAKTTETKKSSAYCFFIREELTHRLRQLAGEQEGSLFMVLLAAFNILLSHVAFQESVMVGIPAAARPHWSLQNIIGLFVNTLILQTKVKTKETFKDFMTRFQTEIFKVLENQAYPLELIFSELKIKYPEISAFFNMLNLGTGTRESITDFESFHIPEVQETKFALHCYLNEYKNGIKVECHYFRELFKPETIEKLMQIYLRILENSVESPLKKIKELTRKKRVR